MEWLDYGMPSEQAGIVGYQLVQCSRWVWKAACFVYHMLSQIMMYQCIHRGK